MTESEEKSVAVLTKLQIALNIVESARPNGVEAIEYWNEAVKQLRKAMLRHWDHVSKIVVEGDI